MSRVFAYCRVSTGSQTTENQVQEILNAGFAVTKQRTIEETVSGSVPAMERWGFTKLIDRMESGDVLIVTKLDRLGRNAMDVRTTVERMAAMGVSVNCIALGNIDLTSSAGKMTMGVIAAVAEFERDLLVERTLAGQATARAAGKQFGRPSTLSEVQQADALSQLTKGITVAAVARAFKTSRQTIMRVRKEGIGRVAAAPSLPV